MSSTPPPSPDGQDPTAPDPGADTSAARRAAARDEAAWATLAASLGVRSGVVGEPALPWQDDPSGLHAYVRAWEEMAASASPMDFDELFQIHARAEHLTGGHWVPSGASVESSAYLELLAQLRDAGECILRLIEELARLRVSPPEPHPRPNPER